MRNTSALAAAALAVTGAFVLAACGGGGDPLADDSAAPSGGSSGAASTSIVVGSAAFPENALLAEIYAGALTKAGVQTSTKLNIGTRETYIPGLKDGSIDLIPEYTGNLLQYLDSKATTTDPAEVEAALAKAVPENLTVLKSSPASDQDSVTVTADTAAKNNLKTISDLAPVAKDMVLAGPPEWATRPTGVPGLEKTYGLKFKEFIKPDTAGPLTVAALKNGQAQAANLFTTDPSIVQNKFVSLEDDKHLFLPGNVVPFINKDKATPEVTDTLNKVSAALTTNDLTGLVKRVVTDKEDAKDVASDWLGQHSLG